MKLDVIKKRIKAITVFLKWKLYSSRKRKIEQVVFHKDKIKVLFFVNHPSMWKCDGLFVLLNDSNRFEPYIISNLLPNDSYDYRRKTQRELKFFFESKGFPYINSYDFENNVWFDIKKFHPDIVFYPQPYNAIDKPFKIESLWHECLFIYIPYCILMEEEEAFDNTLLINICWKVFTPTVFHKEQQSRLCYNKGNNAVVTGYITFDSLRMPANQALFRWKCDDGKKRIIWAPHHSIMDDDLVPYSNFLRYSNFFLKLADKYSNVAQFAFKPHPRLKPRLYNHPDWGKQKTDEYFMKWEQGGNTLLAEGDYIELFKSSDAMIHDSSTFMCEYLLVEKPVMFCVRDYDKMPLNSFGKECLRQHYLGFSEKDIEDFITGVVLNHNDPMSVARNVFVSENLVPSSSLSVADKMFNEIRI